MTTSEWIEVYTRDVRAEQARAERADREGRVELARSLRAAAIGRGFVARRIARLVETGCSVEIVA